MRSRLLTRKGDMTRDQKQASWDAMAAKWTEEEAAWRRNNVGKIRFYLLNAYDDPPTLSAEGQVLLRTVMATFKENEIEVDATFMALDSVDAVGSYAGEIAAFANAFGPVLVGTLVAWLQSKTGQKVKLMDGDIEIEAQTVEDVGKLLEMAAEQRAGREGKENQMNQLDPIVASPPVSGVWRRRRVDP